MAKMASVLKMTTTSEGQSELLSDDGTMKEICSIVVSAHEALESVQCTQHDMFDDEDCEQQLNTTNTLFENIGSEEDIKRWTSAFRTLRNACANCIEGQKYASTANDGNLLGLSVQFASQSLKLGPMVLGDHLNAVLSRRLDLALQACLQFLVNSVTGNESNQQTIWKLLCEGESGRKEQGSWCAVEMIVQAGKRPQNNRRVLSYVVALLHNCCAGSAPGSYGRLSMLTSDKVLVSVLLRHTTSTPPSQESGKERSIAHTEDESDTASDWISLLFENVMTSSLFKAAWNSAGGGIHIKTSPDNQTAHAEVDQRNRNSDVTNNSEEAEGAPIIVITSEQLALLSITSAYLLSQQTEEVTEAVDTERQTQQFNQRDELCESLVDILRTFPPDQKLSRTQYNQGANFLMHHLLNEEGRSLILETLSTLLTESNPSSSPPSVDPTPPLSNVKLVEFGLVEILVELMLATTPSFSSPVNEAFQPTNLSTPPPPPPPQSSSSSYEYLDHECMLIPEGRRVALIKLAANLCYECVEAQNKFREVPSGIVAMLNQCNIDKVLSPGKIIKVILKKKKKHGGMVNRISYVNEM